MNNILLIGAGNMGFAMLEGWLNAVDETHRFAVVDPVATSRCASLVNPDGTPLLAVAELEMLTSDLRFDAAVFATKPGGVCAAIEALGDVLAANTALISVAAGLPMDEIQKGHARPVIRVMPNIGAMVGQSASAGIASDRVTAAQKVLVETLFRALGGFAWLTSEEDMHVVTAVSGSGPAYFFAMCEAMIDAAVDNGLERGVAETLVNGTCTAAGLLISKTPDAVQLRRQVTSPGGTTAAGLDALAQGDGLRSVVANAVAAARKRSIEMGQADMQPALTQRKEKD